MRTVSIPLGLAALLSAIGGLWAEPPAELQKLEQAYNAKVAEIVEPVHKKYLDALVALEKKMSSEGRLEDALRVREKRVAEALKGGSQRPFWEEKKEDKPEFTTAEELARKLAGEVWFYHYAGQGLDEHRLLEFEDGGVLKLHMGTAAGKSQTLLSTGVWKVAANLEVTLDMKAWKQEVKLKFAPDLSHCWGTYTQGSWRYGEPVKPRR